MASAGDFTIDISADTKQAQKQVKSLDERIQDLAESAADFQNKISMVVKAGTSLYAWFKSMKAVSYDFAQNTLKLSNSVELLGGNVGSVDALGNALKRYGGSTEDAVSSLRSLQNAQAEAKKGGGALVEVAKKYGLVINPYSSAEDALMSLSGKLSKFSLQQRVAIGKQLGLSDSLLRAFADGGEELKNLIQKQKELGTITAHDVKRSKEFNNAWLDLTETFESYRRALARRIMPSITLLFKKVAEFFQFLKRHKPLLIALGILIGGLLVKNVIMLTTAFIRLGVASGIFAKIWKMVSPLAKVAAIVGALATIFDDLWVYFNGGISVTGGLIKKFPILAKVIAPLKPLINGIYNTWKAIEKFLDKPSWENFKKIFSTLWGAIKDFTKELGKAFKELFDWIVANAPTWWAEFTAWLGEKWDEFCEWFGVVMAEGWEVAKTWALEIWDDLVAKIKEVWNNVTTSIKEGLKNAWNSAVDWILSTLGRIGSAIKNAFTDAFKSVGNAISGVMGSVGEFFGFGGGQPQPALATAPAMPGQASVINSGGNSSYNSSITINNDINSTNGNQFANGFNAGVNSINAQRQMVGAK